MDQALAAQVKHSCDGCFVAMNDDFNTAQVIAALFAMLKFINAFKNDQLSPTVLGPVVFDALKNTYTIFVQDILGLCQESSVSTTALLDMLLALYRQAKVKKHYDQVDAIRAQLQGLGIALQDTPLGVRWSYT
jgi:cysteinyl-tRNA synthetase